MNHLKYNKLFKYFWPALFGSYSLVLGIYFFKEDPAKLPTAFAFILFYGIYIGVNKYVKRAEINYAPATLLEYISANTVWFLIFLLYFILIKGYFYLKVFMLAMIIFLGIFSTMSVTYYYKKSHRQGE